MLLQERISTQKSEDLEDIYSSTVMIVEQDEAAKDVYRKAFDEENVEVCFFSSGSEAYQFFLDAQNVVIIIVGFDLSDMIGIDFISLFKNYKSSEIPDIVFSRNKNDYNGIQCAFELGVSQVINIHNEPKLVRITLLSLLRNATRRQMIQNNTLRMKQRTELLERNYHTLQNSLDHSQFIQKALFLTEETIESKFDNLFVINRAKHQIGGDFVWIDTINSKFISICADCTGHGISGAMLSTLSYVIIENIIRGQRVFDPGEILTLLHRQFNCLFNTSQSQCGADISICVLDTFTKKWEYASAKGKLAVLSDGECRKLESQRISVGNTYKPEYRFETKVLELKEGDLLIQYSDGITDQFGGHNFKKFSQKRIEKTFKDNVQLPAFFVRK
ncbi:MAG: serine/threonine-protein phosphatase [bacterium]|nr:serine/threonine-protein phosphatase [bacterium]